MAITIEQLETLLGGMPADAVSPRALTQPREWGGYWIAFTPTDEPQTAAEMLLVVRSCFEHCEYTTAKKREEARLFAKNRVLLLPAPPHQPSPSGPVVDLAGTQYPGDELLGELVEFWFKPPKVGELTIPEMMAEMMDRLTRRQFGHDLANVRQSLEGLNDELHEAREGISDELDEAKSELEGRIGTLEDRLKIIGGIIAELHEAKSDFEDRIGALEHRLKIGEGK